MEGDSPPRCLEMRQKDVALALLRPHQSERGRLHRHETSFTEGVSTAHLPQQVEATRRPGSCVKLKAGQASARHKPCTNAAFNRYWPLPTSAKDTFACIRFVERPQTCLGLVKFSARHPEPDIELRTFGTTLLKETWKWTPSGHFHAPVQ